MEDTPAENNSSRSDKEVCPSRRRKFMIKKQRNAVSN